MHVCTPQEEKHLQLRREALIEVNFIYGSLIVPWKYDMWQLTELDL